MWISIKLQPKIWLVFKLRIRKGRYHEKKSWYYHFNHCNASAKRNSSNKSSPHTSHQYAIKYKAFLFPRPQIFSLP